MGSYINKLLWLGGGIICILSVLAWKPIPKLLVVHAPRCSLPLSSQHCPEADRLEYLNDVGYSIIRDFLSADEVDELLALRADAQKRADEGNGYPNRFASYNTWYPRHQYTHIQEFPSQVRRRMETLVQRIANTTRVHVDLLHIGHWHVLEPNISASTITWHSDSDAFFLLPNQHDYLHMQLFLKKAEVGDANVQLVPMTALKDCAPPGLYKTVYSGVGGNYRQRHDQVFGGTKPRWPMFAQLPESIKTVFVNDADFGRRTHLGFTLDEISCSPQMMQGDLLMFRGDLIHKTGPWKNHRISLDIRSARADVQIDPETVLSGGLGKYRYLASQNYEPFVSLFGASRALGMQGLTLEQAMQISTAGTSSDHKSFYGNLAAGFWTEWYRILFNIGYLQRFTEQKLFPG